LKFKSCLCIAGDLNAFTAFAHLINVDLGIWTQSLWKGDKSSLITSHRPIGFRIIIHGCIKAGWVTRTTGISSCGCEANTRNSWAHVAVATGMGCVIVSHPITTPLGIWVDDFITAASFLWNNFSIATGVIG
jgi:hypothetical protein